MEAYLADEAVQKGADDSVGREAWDQAEEEERVFQSAILRDICNPYRPVTIPAALLKWNDRAVIRIAQAIYDERAFDRLPILADALEDADCDDADILSHCRGPGPHVRGCWVVDLLLSKS